METVEKWVKENGCPEFCKYCVYVDSCSEGMVCYGGEPIEPYCTRHDPEDFLDFDAIEKDIASGDI